MSGGYAADKQLGSDRACADHLPACPTCGDLCPPGATVCECGERLLPRRSELPLGNTASWVHDVDCPCLPCYFAGLDGDIRNV